MQKEEIYKPTEYQTGKPYGILQYVQLFEKLKKLDKRENKYIIN